MTHVIVNSREQLEELLRNTKLDKPKNPSQGKICPRCQQKMYRVFIKGVERWHGCACSTGRAHHKIRKGGSYGGRKERV